METIALIACCKSKRLHATRAEDLYCSDLFKRQLAFAKDIGADQIYILSALHGLVSLNQTIQPYDFCLDQMSREEKKEWTNKIIASLGTAHPKLSEVFFIVLAGKTYCEDLLKQLPHYNLPLEHMGIGSRKQYLKLSLNSERVSDALCR